MRKNHDVNSMKIAKKRLLENVLAISVLLKISNSEIYSQIHLVILVDLSVTCVWYSKSEFGLRITESSKRGCLIFVHRSRFARAI